MLSNRGGNLVIKLSGLGPCSGPGGVFPTPGKKSPGNSSTVLRLRTSLPVSLVYKSRRRGNPPYFLINLPRLAR